MSRLEVETDTVIPRDDLGRFRRLDKVAKRETELAGLDAKDILERWLRFTYPRSSSSFNSNVKVRVGRRGNHFQVTAKDDNEIDFLMEEGTKAHTIEPSPERLAQNPRAALRFRIGGRVIYSKRVQHPGTRPTRWMERGGEMADPFVKQRFEKIWPLIFEGRG